MECLFGCLHHLTCRYMAAFVAKYGPVSIALDDMPQLWFPYKGGIMKGCCDKTATHAVLIVGYGEEAGTKYWIIKNRYVRKHRSGQVRHTHNNSADVLTSSVRCVVCATCATQLGRVLGRAGLLAPGARVQPMRHYGSACHRDC